MASKATFLLKPAQSVINFSRNINGWVASITRPHRRVYIKTYPTILQFPDGSTINIQYHAPIGVIKLPLDLSTLSEEQKKQRLLKRIPKTKVKVEDENEDEFDENRYLKYTKKKK